MKKWICLIMAVLMLLLAGCGNRGTNSKADSTNQPVPIGTWQTEIDISELVNERVFGLEEMDVFFLVDSFVLNMEFTVRKDGTYTMKADEKSVQTAVDNLAMLAEEYLILSLEEQLMWLQNEQYGDDLEGTYPEITMEQMLEQNGTTLEEQKKQLQETLGVKTMADEILARANREGTFKAEEGVLYLSKDIQSEIDANSYILYTVEEKALTFVEIYGEETDMEAAWLFPLDWQKVK